MQDYIWLLGYGPNVPEDKFGGCIIDFKDDPVSLTYFEIPCDLLSIGIINDSSGNLLAYSEGCKVFNRVNEVMINGDSISYGAVWNSYCSGYPEGQGLLILPYPGHQTMAVFFHQKINDGFIGKQTLFSIVNFSLDEGNGAVTNKNVMLDSLPLGDYLTAVQHANGRDWWVVTPETEANRFYVYLLSPRGISKADIQAVGDAWGHKYWSGQMTFSPDGSILARVDPNNGLYLYDFDRCTGTLTNQRHFDPFIDAGAAGVAFSADSRFLYVTYLTKIFQLDMHDPDLLSSLVTVAEYDGYQAPFPATFYQAALAPDHKIYLTATNGVNVMHVIEHPERKGLACDVRQHGLTLPVYILPHVPNFPYYRLGPLDGSPCDTLGLDNVPVADFRWEIDTTEGLLVLFRNTSYFLPETYSWTLGDAGFSTEKDPEHLYAAPGIYHVCLTVSNMYGSDTRCRDVDLVATATEEPYSDSPTFTVAPNPFHQTLFIAGHAEGAHRYKLLLVNTMGAVSYAGFLSQYMSPSSIGLEFLPAGLYLYTITNEKGQIQQQGKVVKMD